MGINSLPPGCAFKGSKCQWRSQRAGGGRHRLNERLLGVPCVKLAGEEPVIPGVVGIKDQ